MSVAGLFSSWPKKKNTVRERPRNTKIDIREQIHTRSKRTDYSADVSEGRTPERREAPAQPVRSKTKPDIPTLIEADTATPGLFIGHDVQVYATVTGVDHVVVAGYLEGDLAADTVEILPGGAIHGHISVAGELRVSGLLAGRVNVSARVILTGSGVIKGDLTYRDIVIEPGGSLEGSVQRSP